MSRIILSADEACDLDTRLKERYGVWCYPYHIILGDKQYREGVDITPEDIYAVYREQHILPRTAAVNPKEYINYFKQWTDKGYEVIHLNLSSAISSSYQNCCLAAQELGNVYPIDSRTLSTGIGLLVIEAAERISQGMPVSEIKKEIEKLRTNVEVSFVLDNLTFMSAGGRCPGVVALSANLLNIKPCIEVDNKTGKMYVGKKYRGPLERVLKKYAADKLKNRSVLKLDRIVIAHSGISAEYIDIVAKTVSKLADFKEIMVIRAGCTISSHCGPNTVGIYFMTVD